MELVKMPFQLLPASVQSNLYIVYQPLFKKLFLTGSSSLYFIIKQH